MKQNLLNLKSWLLMMCLLVGVGNAWATKYELVTSATQLVAGCNYIIADGTSSSVNVISTESNTNNRRTTTGQVSNSAITGTDAMMVFELGGSSNAWTFTTTNYLGTDGDLYNDDTNNNRLKVGSDTKTNEFTISFSNNAISSITCNGNTSKGVMCFNGALVACYGSKSSSYKVPQLYKESKEVTIEYNVTISNNIQNGTVSANVTKAEANATVKLTATPASGYKLDSWNVTNAATNSAITVTNNQFTMPAADVNVSALFSEIQYYTITWSVNGNTSTIEPSQLEEGANITFPTGLEDIYGKKFVGWSANENASSASDLVSGKVSASADAIYYAVFATQAGDGAETLSKVTSTDQITAGTYALICYDETKYVSNALATGSCPAQGNVSKTNDKISITDAMKWTVSGNNTDGFVFTSAVKTAKNEDVYLWGGSANDGTRVNNTSGKANATKNWFVVENTTYGLILYNKATTDNRYLSTYNSEWRNYTNINATTQKPVNLYKVVSGYTYSDYTTTPTYTLSELAEADVEITAMVSISFNNEIVGIGINEETQSITLKDGDNTFMLLANTPCDSNWKVGGTLAGIWSNVMYLGQTGGDGAHMLNNTSADAWNGLTYTAPAGPTYTENSLTLVATDGDFYYATFSSDKVTFFPNDYIVSAVGVEKGKLYQFDNKDAFDEGNVEINGKDVTGYYVPANTGVLICSTDAAVNYYTVDGVTPSTDVDAVNMLRAASVAKTGDFKFYMLGFSDSTMKPETLGFYWGAADGAAFTSREGSAYLAVPTADAANVKGFSFVVDDATSIQSVENNKVKTNAVYNLAGQRVSSKSYKGIVIKNGKQILNK